VPREDTDSPSSASTKNKAAAAAAAAAARINAQIQAKKGIQHVDVPPIRSVRLVSIVALLLHPY
jgi:homoaconitase